MSIIWRVSRDSSPRGACTVAIVKSVRWIGRALAAAFAGDKSGVDGKARLLSNAALFHDSLMTGAAGGPAFSR